MPLVHFFETSFGRTTSGDIILVEVAGRGRRPAGAKSPPARIPSTTRSGPTRRGSSCAITPPRACSAASSQAPEDVAPLTAHIRGHNMARGGLEAAVWDLEARLDGIPLWKKIGGGRAARDPLRRLASAFRIRWTQLLEKIERELAAGYQRIKMKIKPGWDVDVSATCASAFPPSS